jgi:hypothetical protein
MSFTPHSTTSTAHKKLMMTVAHKHLQKTTKSKQYIVLQDPEKETRDAEKAENELSKARKKLEAKKLAALRSENDDVR